MTTGGPLYVYRATIVGVTDGDSVTVLTDLGFYVTARVKVRLIGINARELTMPGGKEARDHLAELLPVGLVCILDSVGVDKYGGRSSGRLILPDRRSVADVMVTDGYAARWTGTGPRPVPPWPAEPELAPS